MAAYEWLFVDLVALMYNLSWLVFLTRQHYGQVTTTAGHIFELNVLLNVNITNILMIFLLDLEVLFLGNIFELLFFGLFVAIAASQFETMLFLKTLNVNTMMTNTAGIIILAMNIFSYVLAVINVFAWPSTMVPQSEVKLCDYITPMAMNFNRMFILIFIYTVTLVIVLSAMGYGLFRSLQIRRTRDNDEHRDNLSSEELGQETGVMSEEDTRVFTIQVSESEISELNHERPREVMEEDLVIQDIELDNVETPPFTDQLNVSETENQQKQLGCDTPSQGRLFTIEEAISDLDQIETRQRIESSPSIDHVMINEITQEMNVNIMNPSMISEVQQDPIGCAPGIDMILKTIHKYMKNSMISLLFLTSLLPWYSTVIYGFISNSGCENPTLKFMEEMSEYVLYMVVIPIPLVIKHKLDRLSE